MPKGRRPKRVDYPDDYVFKVGFKCDKHQIVITRSALTNEGEEVWRDHAYHSNWKSAITNAINTQLRWLVDQEPQSIVKDGKRFLQLWDKTIDLVNVQLEEHGHATRIPAREEIEIEDEEDEEDEELAAVISAAVDDLVDELDDL